MSNVHISVVSPIYGCAECLEELCQRLCSTLSTITENYEIVLVNDASPDDSWVRIERLARENDRVKGVSLSRNFGQHYAIAAGLEYACGEWVVVMDGDLQDQPEEIFKLYSKAQEGYQQVVGVRENRKDSYFVSLTSKLFYVVFNYLSDNNLDNRVANYGIYSRAVVDSIRRYKEKDRSFGLLVAMVGFSRAEISIEHAARSSGESGYDFSKRLSLALDHILSHSNKPLLIAVRIGFVCSLLATLYILWLIMGYFVWGNTVTGWTSVMVSQLFLSGLIISVVGMVGIYIGKIYNEVKERPLYIVDKMTFHEDEQGQK